MRIGNPKLAIFTFFDPKRGHSGPKSPQNVIKPQFSSDWAETWWVEAFLQIIRIGNPKSTDKNVRLLGSNAVPMNFIPILQEYNLVNLKMNLNG